MFHRADRALARLVRPIPPAESGGMHGEGIANGDTLVLAAHSRDTHDRLSDEAFEVTAAEAQAEGRPLTRDRLRAARDLPPKREMPPPPAPEGM